MALRLCKVSLQASATMEACSHNPLAIPGPCKSTKAFPVGGVSRPPIKALVAEEEGNLECSHLSDRIQIQHSRKRMHTKGAGRLGQLPKHTSRRQAQRGWSPSK